MDGLLATMYDSRTLHTREVLAGVVQGFGDKVFHTVISRTVRFPDASVAGEPITRFDPTSNGASCLPAACQGGTGAVAPGGTRGARSRRVSLPGVAELLVPIGRGPGGRSQRQASGRERHAQKITVTCPAASCRAGARALTLRDGIRTGPDGQRGSAVMLADWTQGRVKPAGPAADATDVTGRDRTNPASW